MSFQVIITPRANRDINHNYDYLEASKGGLGFDFLFQVGQLIEKLEFNPIIFQLQSENVRRGLLKKFKHSVWYRVEGNLVYVLHISGPGQYSEFL